MKNKKIVIYILLGVLAAGLLGSCAVDKRCPAYGNAGVGQVSRSV